MTTGFQVTFDAGDPRALAQFWREALGYVDQPQDESSDTWWALVDPDGRLPRVFFQQVPEGKTAKNRLHLDVNVGAGMSGDERPIAVRAAADRLVGLGASEQRTVDENGEFWIVMLDPEGNEFCVQ